MPRARVQKPIQITAPIKHQYFVYPIGSLASENILNLLGLHQLDDTNDRIENLRLGDKTVPTWRISRESMFQITDQGTSSGMSITASIGEIRKRV